MEETGFLTFWNLTTDNIRRRKRKLPAIYLKSGMAACPRRGLPVFQDLDVIRHENW
jgi:hypothetical protein